MTDLRAASREGLPQPPSSGSRAMQERAERIVHERATVEATLGRLRSEEQSLLEELSALSAERGERARELAEAREHLASLDVALAGEELAEGARAQDLAHTRHRLERDRQLASRLEEEILEVRRQMSSAQEGIRGLVQNVLRIQHKLWRAAQRSGKSPLTSE